MYSLQTSVQIDQVSFNIRNQGDYRMVLDCFEALNDPELSKDERIYASLIIFYEDFSDVTDFPKSSEQLNELVLKMFEFFNQSEVVETGAQSLRLIDWQKDSNLIISAVNNVANQEIRSVPYLHWWTFLGYYMAIGECPLSFIVSLRHKKAKNEKLEKYEKKFIQENPQYFNVDMRSVEQKEADEYIKQLWGNT